MQPRLPGLKDSWGAGVMGEWGWRRRPQLGCFRACPRQGTGVVGSWRGCHWVLVPVQEPPARMCWPPALAAPARTAASARSQRTTRASPVAAPLAGKVGAWPLCWLVPAVPETASSSLGLSLAPPALTVPVPLCPTGQTCEIDINECVKSPCRNGATCQNTNGSYRCACRTGFTGRNCDTDIDDCKSSKSRGRPWTTLSLALVSLLG